MADLKLRILHVSDLHERGPGERARARRYRVLGPAWRANIAAILDDGPVDLVCFTGDVAQTGSAAEYTQATPFVTELLDQLSLNKDDLFVVPGNHDVNRGASGSPQRRAFRALRKRIHRADDLEVSHWLAGGDAPLGINAAHRDLVLARQSDYRAWIEKGLGRPELLPSESLHKYLGYRVTRKFPGGSTAVHIIGLDSAWYAGDDNDAGKLLLTEDQLIRLCTDEKGASLPGLRIALMHHPLAHLADADVARSRLASHVDLLLCGHVHVPARDVFVEFDGALRQLAAGCLYEGDREDRHPNSCNVIEIIAGDDGRWRYRVTLRGFSPATGRWELDPDRRASASDGRIAWSAPGAVDTPTTPLAADHSVAIATPSPLGAAGATPPTPPTARPSPTVSRDRVVFIAGNDTRPTLEALRRLFEPVEKLDVVRTWDHTQIEISKHVEEETVRALGTARVGVLLVSPGLLTERARDITALLEGSVPLICLHVKLAPVTAVHFDYNDRGAGGTRRLRLTQIRGVNDSAEPLEVQPATKKKTALKRTFDTAMELYRRDDLDRK